MRQAAILLALALLFATRPALASCARNPNLSTFRVTDQCSYDKPCLEEQANKLTPDGIGLARTRVASDVILQERLRDKLIELGLLGAPQMWGPKLA